MKIKDKIFKKDSSILSPDDFVDCETFDKILKEGRYDKDDSLDVLFGKYESLCDLSMMKLDKRQKEKVHNARMTFVAEITTPQDVEQSLSLVIRAMPYARKTIGSEVAQTLANIGLGAINTVSAVGKIATLGALSKSMNQVESITKKAITSDDYELACAWETKLQHIIADMKKKLKTFGDKELKSRISELEKQLK